MVVILCQICDWFSRTSATYLLPFVPRFYLMKMHFFLWLEFARSCLSLFLVKICFLFDALHLFNLTDACSSKFFSWLILSSPKMFDFSDYFPFSLDIWFILSSPNMLDCFSKFIFLFCLVLDWVLPIIMLLVPLARFSR